MTPDKAAILVKKAALEFDKISNTAMSKYDLTPAQYKVIKYLYLEAENGVRTVDLERYYSMTHPTTIGILQNLQKKGLIWYADHPDDKRSRLIVPTEKAMEMKDELEHVGNELESEFTNRLSDEERDEFIGLLKKLLGLGE